MTEILNVIESKLCSKWINIHMSQEEKREAKQFFYNSCGFPGVLGAIDGTHIQIYRPSINEHLFFNRKHHHSLNAMIVSTYYIQNKNIKLQ